MHFLFLFLYDIYFHCESNICSLLKKKIFSSIIAIRYSKYINSLFIVSSKSSLESQKFYQKQASTLLKSVFKLFRIILK